jgi:hypothetical protein
MSQTETIVVPKPDEVLSGFDIRTPSRRLVKRAA